MGWSSGRIEELALTRRESRYLIDGREFASLWDWRRWYVDCGFRETRKRDAEAPRGKRSRTRVWHTSARGAAQYLGMSAAAEIAPLSRDRDQAVPTLGAREGRICRESPGALSSGLETRNCADYPAPSHTGPPFRWGCVSIPGETQGRSELRIQPGGRPRTSAEVHRQPLGCCR